MRNGFRDEGSEIDLSNDQEVIVPESPKPNSIPELDSLPYDQVDETAEYGDDEGHKIDGGELFPTISLKPLFDDSGNVISETGGKLRPNNTFFLFGAEISTDDKGRIYCIDGEKLSNTIYEKDGHEYKTDDNGKIYCRDGVCNPNDTFYLDGHRIETDDNGNIYMVDGKLLPNTTYVSNGNKYTTDEKGRPVKCEATPKLSPDNPRDNNTQKRAGGADRRENDQGGHIVSRELGGDSGDGNLVAMDGRINQSDYRHMENTVASALREGKQVTVVYELTFSDDSERPDKIKVTVTIDDKVIVYIFDNNMDGSLIDEVPEEGKEAVLDELEETGGVVSSIKKEYDENGNLISTTVTITYTGEDGKNHRTYVVIDNTQGGANQ